MLGSTTPRCPVCRRGIAGVTRGYQLELLHSRLKTFATSWPQVLLPTAFDMSDATAMKWQAQRMLPEEVSDAVNTFQARLDALDKRMPLGAATGNTAMEPYERAELRRRRLECRPSDTEEQIQEDEANESFNVRIPSYVDVDLTDQSYGEYIWSYAQ
jgi:hypothetical protein